MFNPEHLYTVRWAFVINYPMGLRSCSSSIIRLTGQLSDIVNTGKVTWYTYICIKLSSGITESFRPNISLSLPLGSPICVSCQAYYRYILSLVCGGVCVLGGACVILFRSRVSSSTESVEGECVCGNNLVSQWTHALLQVEHRSNSGRPPSHSCNSHTFIRRDFVFIFVLKFFKRN